MNDTFYLRYPLLLGSSMFPKDTECLVCKPDDRLLSVFGTLDEKPDSPFMCVRLPGTNPVIILKRQLWTKNLQVSNLNENEHERQA